MGSSEVSGGGALGKLDAQQKRYLLGALARGMHESNVAEVPENEVIRIFAERLPELGAKATDALDILRHIRERSGLLVERRPGYYGFSHLTFQEYLTAVEMVRAGAFDELVNKYYSRWWREVTVLAAGHPGTNAAKLIQGLLSIEAREPYWGATLLAAQCAETAILLASSVREAVERRLARFVPPRSNGDVRRLVQLGDVAGSVLLSALQYVDAAGRAYTCVALGYMNYEPASDALARLMLDETCPDSDGAVDYEFGEMEISFFAPKHSVAAFATLALFNMCLSLETVRATFERALKGAPRCLLFMKSILSEAEFMVGKVALAYSKELGILIQAPVQQKQRSRHAARSG